MRRSEVSLEQAEQADVVGGLIGRHAAGDVAGDRGDLGLKVDHVGFVLKDRVIPGAIAVADALIDQRRIIDIAGQGIAPRFPVAADVADIAGSVEILVGPR